MLKLEITGFTAEEILNYALVGLLARHQHMANKIADIRGQLTGNPTSPDTPAVPAAKRGRPAATAAAKPSGRRPLSPEARANIVRAQKKRWAKVHKDQRAAEGTTATQGRRRMQLAGPEPQGELAEAAS